METLLSRLNTARERTRWAADEVRDCRRPVPGANRVANDGQLILSDLEVKYAELDAALLRACLHFEVSRE